MRGGETSHRALIGVSVSVIDDESTSEPANRRGRAGRPGQVVRRGAGRRRASTSRWRAARPWPARPERRRQVDDHRHDARPDPTRPGPRRAVRDVPGRRHRGRRGRRHAADGRADPRPVGARADHDDGVAVSRTRSTVDEVLAVTGLHEVADRRTQKLSGGQTQRTRFALGVGVRTPTCWCSTSRRSPSTSRPGTASGRSMRAFAARGKTVVFATHYLEEADAYADRVVLMSRVASSPTARRPRSRRGSAADHPGDARRCRRWPSSPRCPA